MSSKTKDEIAEKTRAIRTQYFVPNKGRISSHDGQQVGSKRVLVRRVAVHRSRFQINSQNVQFHGVGTLETDTFMSVEEANKLSATGEIMIVKDKYGKVIEEQQ